MGVGEESFGAFEVRKNNRIDRSKENGRKNGKI